MTSSAPFKFSKFVFWLVRVFESPFSLFKDAKKTLSFKYWFMWWGSLK